MNIERTPARGPAARPAETQPAAEAPKAAAATRAARPETAGVASDSFAATASGRPAEGRGGQEAVLQELIQARESRSGRRAQASSSVAAEPVPRAVAELGLDHVAKLLREAAGKDGVLSRKDASRLVTELQGQGKKTEARAADLFFRFLDQRDAGSGARVTRKDVDQGVEYAREHLLRNKDRDGDGYEPNEIKKLSATGRALLEAGKVLAAGGTPGTEPPGQTAARFAKDLEKKADGLTFISETDAPYKAFSKPLGKDVPLTQENFMKALGLPQDTPSSVRSFDDYFTYVQDDGTGFPEDVRAQHKALEEAMRKGLTDLQIIYLHDESVVQAPVYVVGKTPQGDLAGLETMRVWT